MHTCIIANASLVYFPEVISQACLMCLSGKWEWCDWTWLKIATQLAREFGLFAIMWL